MTIILFVLGIGILYFLAAINVVALVYTLIGLIDPGRTIKHTFLYVTLAAIFWPIVGLILLLDAMRGKYKSDSIEDKEREVIDKERERMVKQYEDRLNRIMDLPNDPS